MITKQHSKESGAQAAAQAAFTGLGFAAAFGAASCCALPVLFAGAGLGTAWLTSIALVASPYRGALLVFAAASLAVGAILLWRQQRAARVCAPGGHCASLTSRLVPLAALVAGTILLWLGYSYV